MISTANDLALQRLKNASPRFVDVKQAKDLLPDFDKYTILHAGPPIKYLDMCAPMQEAVHAALIYEDLAVDREDAKLLASSSKIKYSPCHSKGVVGPMTGVTSWSMPLLVVENTDYGNYAYSTINEGGGDVIRFGACTDNTIKRLKWIENTLAPCLKKVVDSYGGIDLTGIIAQAVTMGDELHMRNNASSRVFVYEIVSRLAQVNESEEFLEVIEFLTSRNDQFFLNFAMAANKSAADAASNIPGSSIVTAIARNGVEVGIKVSGLKDEWFTAPAPAVDGLYFSGFDENDSNPDLGDSAIMEVNGFGAFAMAAGPAIVQILGIENTSEAFELTEEMTKITHGEHFKYSVSTTNFSGLPLGIDVMKVIESNITPAITTAIAGKEPGVGMIGAGLSRVPYLVFDKAIRRFDEVVQELYEK